MLFARPVRDELGREDLTERGIVAPPTEADQLYQGFGFLTLLLRDVAAQRALGISAEKHQMRDFFGVTRGICDGEGTALRHTEKRKLFEALRLDHGIEIIEPCLERGWTPTSRTSRSPAGHSE